MNAGKNKRRQLIVDDTFHNVQLSVDSAEEVDFVNWCCEAADLSVISDFQYQPSSYVLFESAKYTDCYGKTKSLFQDHVYSPDFILEYDPKKYMELNKEFKIQYSDIQNDQISVVIDVKGTFNRTGRSFSTDRKWMWQKFKIYVCEVIPLKFFKVFGCPLKSFYTKKTKKARKQFSGYKSIKNKFDEFNQIN